VQGGCRSVAFTYNDPVIFLEYAVDVAQACRERGIKTERLARATSRQSHGSNSFGTWTLPTLTSKVSPKGSWHRGVGWK
jgi:hypothetical protein